MNTDLCSVNLTPNMRAALDQIKALPPKDRKQAIETLRLLRKPAK